MIIIMAIYMTETVKVNWFKAIIENLDHLSLKKASKIKNKVLNFFGDFI